MKANAESGVKKRGSREDGAEERDRKRESAVQVPVFLFAFGLEGISGGAEHPHIPFAVADSEIFGIRLVQKAVHVGADGDFAGEEMAAER